MAEETARATGRISAFDPLAAAAATASGEPGASRPKILALCGAKSNNAVTRLQLANLHITSDTHDVHYLHGNIEEAEGDPALGGMFHGPFYSWIDGSTPEAANESVVNAVRLVLKAARAHGPFDGIYGFSNGKFVIVVVCI